MNSSWKTWRFRKKSRGFTSDSIRTRSTGTPISASFCACSPNSFACNPGCSTTKSGSCVIFEGRDSAGKGGAIKRITQRLNPRVARTVALPAPSDREKTQWYFQRYVPHLPAGGEIVFFDRSWYNRAGVERVMGFRDRGSGRAVLPRRSRIRADAASVGHPCDQILVLDHGRGSSRCASHADPRSDEAVEAVADGPSVTGAVGAVHQGQGGRDVRADEYSRGAMVHRRGQRQEARAAELHRPPAEPCPLRGLCRTKKSRCPTGSSTRTTNGQPCRPSYYVCRSIEVAPRRGYMGECLSYQHMYHAGNIADVHKHAMLALTLDYMVQKDKPLSYIESHAGRGTLSPRFRRSPEDRRGGAGHRQVGRTVSQGTS